jgi:hypothetical protein
MTAVTVDCDENSAGDKAATGRTLSCRAERGRTMSAVPQAPSRKAREGAHPQLFGRMLKAKPAFYLPVKVAHPPSPRMVGSVS